MVTDTNHPYGGYSQGEPEEMYEGYNSGGQSINANRDGYFLHYPDPAIINPEELATFPKQVKTDAYHHHHHESHLVNKRTPVRDGRNITRTDNHPDKNGYM